MQTEHKHPRLPKMRPLTESPAGITVPIPEADPSDTMTLNPLNRINLRLTSPRQIAALNLLTRVQRERGLSRDVNGRANNGSDNAPHHALRELLERVADGYGLNEDASGFV